jgi:hypothetical protein
MSNIKNNLIVPNKLTAADRIQLIAMHQGGVRNCVIARELGVSQPTVKYHIDRMAWLIGVHDVRPTDDAPTMTSQPPKGDTLVTKGYLVGSTYYGTFAEVASAVTIGDTVETITVTSTQVVGLVESKEG